MEDLQYPIGKFQVMEHVTDEQRARWIAQVSAAPGELAAAIAGLSEQQLDTPYRPGGWTVRQVVHHLPDSHMNSYIRFKLAMTEDQPTIKPYAEDRWASLSDYRDTPIQVSLALFASLHARWAIFLSAMSEADFKRTFRHPEAGTVYDLETALALYAWHGRHHIAHIQALRQRQGW